jgi:diguanylate cyclase (GGDEF)-like protein
LQGSYNTLLVAISFLIAVLASYAALELSFRTYTSQHGSKWIWLLSGAIAAGTGIWAMHFVGMLAYSLPIPIGFDPWITLASWCAPVLFSAFALSFVHKPEIARWEFALSSLLMGLAIAGMHYLGMFAMRMVPPIQWNLLLVAISILIAVGLSGAAIWTLRHMLTEKKANSYLLKICIAILLGTAIWTMHYTGMWAASFPANSVCLSADQLNSDWLPTLVTVPTVFLLGVSSAIAYYDRRRLEHQILAETDALTGFKNRRYLQKFLPQLLQQTQSKGQSLHLAYLDLDGFKLINDTMGHDVGDSVLVIVSKRICDCLRRGDQIIRMGGDEFVLLLTDAQDASIEHILNRILGALHEPMQIGNHTVQISGSIGLAKHNNNLEADPFLIQADNAMYHAKHNGRNRWQRFTENMDKERIHAAEIHKGLLTALERHEFRLFYQPKYSCYGRRIVGLEALLRWKDSQDVWHAPSEFIEIAEKTGLIVALGDWVLDEACRQINCWVERGLEIPIAINVSALQIRGDGITSKVIRALALHHVEARLLTIEVTESTAVDDPEQALLIFKELQNLGVTISIDDFGTGYSSLSYLKDFPATEIKIDRAFVSDVATNNQAKELLKAIIVMGHALGMTVVAEGVEDETTAAIMEELNCDIVQGYYFAKPLPVDEIEAMLTEQALSS